MKFIEKTKKLLLKIGAWCKKTSKIIYENLRSFFIKLGKKINVIVKFLAKKIKHYTILSLKK